MAQYMWGDSETEFFFQLTPDLILNSVEALGLTSDGRCMTLNSMENRVYEIGIEKDEVDSESDRFIIAKFYRPGRWTREQILEEHSFLFALEDAEVPVVAPLKIEGESLFKLADHQIFFCLFPKRGGRINTELNFEQLEIIGRTLARLHNVGEQSEAKHRLKIAPETFGLQNLNFLLEKKIIPITYEASYKKTVENIVQLSRPLFTQIKNIRLHGDCHWGNIIWRDESSPLLIDFDDMLVGPAVQDIWLTVPGNDQHSRQDREVLLESYQSMREFDRFELKLVEPLRALRFIHFSAWIAKRWEDPYFKKAFPHFGTDDYWSTQLRDLEEQHTLISS